MSNIKTIEILTPSYVYETTDGKIHPDYDDAMIAQDIINGSKKQCTICGGNGYIMYDHEIFGFTGVDNGGYPTDTERRERKCEDCEGRGYLELKFA